MAEPQGRTVPPNEPVGERVFWAHVLELNLGKVNGRMSSRHPQACFESAPPFGALLGGFGRRGN